MSWKWEVFEGLLTPLLFQVVDAGPLRQPVLSFKIYRNEKLDLILETRSSGMPNGAYRGLPAGTVRVSTEKVEFASQAGYTGVAHGLIRAGINGTWDGERNSESTETTKVGSIEIILRPNAEPKCVIDWVANLDSRGIWIGSQAIDKTETAERRTIGEGERAIELTSTNEGYDSSNCALYLNVDGVDLYVCATKVDAARKIREPGYILYSGNPDEYFRKKIRNVLSFCLGSCLIHLGSSTVDAESELTSVHAISSHDFDGRIFEIPNSPPAPLGLRYEHEIDQAILSRMVNALFENYDDLRFSELSWAYWHAVCAPVHMAASHFGAAIEALEEAYANSGAGKVSTKVVDDRDKFSDLKDSLLSALNAADLDDNARKIFANKVAGLNSLPQSAKSERILTRMGLSLGDMEMAAWKRRNSAAHGEAVSEESGVSVIRETKILKLILHRMVLKISNASDRYYDYYTIGRPVRQVTEPVPPDN